MKFTIFNLKYILSDNVATLVFFLAIICLKYIFPSLCFQSICIFKTKMSLLQAAYGWDLYFYLFYLHPLIRAFTLFTFKVIIDR